MKVAQQQEYCAMICCVLQLLRQSYNELKLLETVSLSPAENNLQNDASGPSASVRQQELIEKVLKNVAIASEVL